MTDLLAMLFLEPLDLSRIEQALMLLPLCLAISLVYKTTKCGNTRSIPLAAAANWGMIIVGMYAVGIVLLIIYRLVA